jgi:hypothetical protein
MTRPMRLWACLLLGLAAGASAQDTLRVLFVGNSHTYTYNLPALVRQLAEGAGHPLVTGMSAPGGYTLRQHVQHEPTRAAILGGDWDWVVLQEQSQLPVIPHWRDSWMTPAATTLDSLATSVGSATALFMTWGWRDGGNHCILDSCASYDDFFHMQDSMAVAYRRLGERLDAPVAEAGEAFRRALRADPFADFWAPDGYHPNLEGSYLAACVFHQLLFAESPVGLPYPAGLDLERARWLQEMAAGEVMVAPAARPVSQDLLRAWPNPFNPQLNLVFRLDEPGVVRLTVHDLWGRRVDAQELGWLGAGVHRFGWRGALDQASGRLWLSLEVDGRRLDVESVTLLR